MKILFTDLDGTLLTGDKRISDPDLASIRQMTDAGHRFVIASGRPLPSVLKLVEAYDLIVPNFYVSCFNGSLIYDCYAQKKIQELAVPYDCVQYLFDETAKEGLHIHTYSDTHVIAARETEEYHYYLKHIHMPGIVDANFQSHMTHEPYKVIIMSFESRSRLEAFRIAHASWEKDRLEHTYSCDHMLEYTALGATKGNSLIALCKHFQIPVSDSVAIGDEENDISMIDAAGLGIVMKNGTENAKKHAGYITENDNDHNAITEIIQKFIL